MSSLNDNTIPWYQSLAFKIILGFIPLLILPIIIISYDNYQTSNENLKKNAFNEIKHSAMLEKRFIQDWFAYRKIDITKWAENEHDSFLLQELSEAYKTSHLSLDAFIKSNEYASLSIMNEGELRSISHKYSYIYDLFLIDTEGNILLTMAKEDDLATNLFHGKYADTKFAISVAKTLKDKKVHFSDLERYGASANIVTGFFTAPMYNEEGELLGVFAVQIKIEKIYQLLKLEDSTNTEINRYLVGNDGLLRSSITNENEILKLKVDTRQFNLWRKEHVGSQLTHDLYDANMNENVFIYLDPFKERVFGLHQDIEILGVNWGLINEVKMKDIDLISNAIVLKTIEYVFILSLIVIVISILIAKNIVKPIRELSEVTTKFSQGNRDINFNIKAKGEVGVLVQAFKNMMEAIINKEDKLIYATKIAQDSVKTKSEFLASMSHEIRTPMNGVLGMLTLLLKSDLNEKQKHQVQIASSSAKALLTLINDILDFSKIEAGKLDLEELNFDIRSELDNFSEAFAISAQDKGLEFVLDMHDIEQSMIISDSGRIRQILSNLVGNAIKFTSSGFISITASLEKEANNQGRLHIAVQDSGIGIPEDKLAILFDSFSQVDASTTRTYGGTGLGLAIAKQLCELMDGSLRVESKITQGSIFFVDIGVKLLNKEANEKKDIFLDTKNALIIDAHDLSAQALQNQLRQWHLSVDIAKTSEATLAYRDKFYDIIFIDKNIDIIECKTLLENFKSDVKFTKTKFILMSNLNMMEKVIQDKNICFDKLLTKPYTTSDLFDTISILADTHHEQSIDEIDTDETQNIIQFKTSPNILLVDDNKTNQLVANGLLEDYDIEADVANDGLEALQALRVKEYDLVFMDCQMPNLDGYGATRAIRNGEAGKENKSIIIVAMTANAMQEDKEKCFTSGMDDYIAKPINPAIFEEKLQKYLS